MDAEEKLAAHERECAVRYQALQDSMERQISSLDKRMWRLEAMIMGSTVLLVGLASSLLMKL